MPQVNYEIRVIRTNNTEYPYELDFRNIVPSYSNIVEVQGYKNYTGTELINTVYSDGVVKFAELPACRKYWYDTGAYVNGNSQLLSVNLTFELAPLNPEYELWYKFPDDYNIGNEFYGELPNPVDWTHLATNAPIVSETSATFITTSMPSTYDLRDTSGLPPVRNQEKYGTFWAHSALGAVSLTT